MSERITAANLDEVIKRNEVIEEQMKQSASLIWSKYNPMQINTEAPMLNSFRQKGILFVGLMKQSTALLSILKM